MALVNGVMGGIAQTNPYLDEFRQRQIYEDMLRQQSYAAMANQSVQQNCAMAREPELANPVLLLLGDASA